MLGQRSNVKPREGNFAAALFWTKMFKQLESCCAFLNDMLCCGDVSTYYTSVVSMPASYIHKKTRSFLFCALDGGLQLDLRLVGNQALTPVRLEAAVQSHNTTLPRPLNLYLSCVCSRLSATFYIRVPRRISSGSTFFVSIMTNPCQEFSLSCMVVV